MLLFLCTYSERMSRVTGPECHADCHSTRALPLFLLCVFRLLFWVIRFFCLLAGAVFYIFAVVRRLEGVVILPGRGQLPSTVHLRHGEGVSEAERISRPGVVSIPFCFLLL